VKIDSKVLDRVLDVKSRSISETERGVALKNRLDNLYGAWVALKDLSLEDPSRREFARYFPVALVGLIQGFFTFAVRDLIDCCDKFKLNSSKILDAQFSISAIVTVEKKNLSIGEITANSISLSSPQNIYSNLETITDNLFLKSVKEYPLRCPSCEAIHTCEALVPSMFSDVSVLFAKRNILAHEIASKEQIREAEIDQWFKSVSLLLLISDNVIFELYIEARRPGLLEMVKSLGSRARPSMPD
jgi:hypothetical protein